MDGRKKIRLLTFICPFATPGRRLSGIRTQTCVIDRDFTREGASFLEICLPSRG